MTLNIEMEYETPLEFDWEDIARKVTEAALDYEHCPYETEINLVLTGNEEIQRTNREFRDIDRITDVLSFPPSGVCLFDCPQYAASHGLRPHDAGRSGRYGKEAGRNTGKPGNYPVRK